MTADAAELHRQLIDRVAELRSSESWLETMAAAARFPDYSLGNWMLIWSQAEARETQVIRPAGYRTWQQLGRQVRKGERGYRILAPLTRRAQTEDDSEDPTVVGFRVVTVFDLSQTEGRPIPDTGPRLLEGTGDAELFEATVGMIEDQGYRFSLGRLRGANGETRPRTREVVVEANLSDAQLTKTTVHELAHVLMHTDTEPVDCRGRIEVEAESVAYVVCSAAGLDTSAYSVAYVAGWAEATVDPARTLLATGERVVHQARRILDYLSEHQQSAHKLEHSALTPCDTTRNVDMMSTPSAVDVVTKRKEGR